MLEISDLSVGYGQRVLLGGVEARFAPGQLVALIGRNGSGKSTLLRVLAGLMVPLRGSVAVDGTDMARCTPPELARLVALVTTERVRVPGLSARQVVELGRAPYTDWIGRLNADDRQAVEEALSLTGTEHLASRSIDTLSDGECQRVMIARALAQNTPVMLLDEPTSFLDMPNRYRMCMLLRQIAAQRGTTIVFSTHELDIALDLCSTVALIDSPHLVWGSPDQIIASGALQKLFSGTDMTFDPVSRRMIMNTHSDFNTP